MSGESDGYKDEWDLRSPWSEALALAADAQAGHGRGDEGIWGWPKTRQSSSLFSWDCASCRHLAAVDVGPDQVSGCGGIIVRLRVRRPHL